MAARHSWRWVGGSVRGTSHLRAGIPCQDASAISAVGVGPDGPILLLVCADGAGSAELSQEGAIRAVRCLVASATNFVADGGRVSELTESGLIDWYCDAAAHIEEEADAADRPIRDYACTLLCAVVDGEAAAYAQLGDGAIVAGCGNDVEPVFWPQHGEYANTTYFITASEHLGRIQARAGAEVPERLALMTDGLQNLALRFADRSAHAAFFAPLFADLLRQPDGEAESLSEPLRDFLDSPRVNARTDDDKTLLLAIRKLPAAESEDGSELGQGPEPEAFPAAGSEDPPITVEAGWDSPSTQEAANRHPAAAHDDPEARKVLGEKADTSDMSQNGAGVPNGGLGE